MERLTQRDEAGRAMLTKFGMQMYCSTQATADCFAKLEERLAAYEDTGLEPEEITDYLPMLKEWRQNMGALRHVHELVTAESEGLLPVLPCKVGDAVYLRDLTPCKVVGINIGHYTRTVTIEFNDGDRVPNWQPRGFDEFGVSVFTTREAAEAALKEREGA